MSDETTRYEFFKRDQEIEGLQVARNRIKKELEEQAELFASTNDQISELQTEIAELKAHIELVDNQLSKNTVSLTERIDRLSDRFEKLERAKP